MKNRQKIITMAVLTALTIGNSVSLANNSNDLLRMDVKKSGASDTVDVTFYTTGGATDSVVTRKSDNKYVVLLPNIAGSQSVAPSLGGVKDLVTDVSVKNVDDGIGGYTKVTFSTTKPVKFQTYTKKTAPLTQAQQDYKNLIASSSKLDTKKTQTTPTANTTANTTKPAVQAKTNTTATPKTATPAKTAVKPTVKDTKTTSAAQAKPTVKPSNTTQKTANNTPKTSTSKPEQTKTVAKKSETKPQQQPKAQKVTKPAAVAVAMPKSIQTADSIDTNVTDNVPKMQFDKNGKRTMDLEPKVDHRTVKTSVEPKVDAVNTNVNSDSPVPNASAPNEASKKQDKKGLPIFPVAGGLSALGILLLAGVISKLTHSASKNSSKLRESFDNFDVKQSKKRGKAYKNLMDDNTLSWQEKYKQYTQKEEEYNKDSNTNKDYSYVTNMKTSQGTLFSKKHQNQDLRAAVSKMEHALSQTPSLNANIEAKTHEVVTDEASVVNKMNSVKLKSFAKNMSLKEANRATLKASPLTETVKNKESHFVRLRNSALSVSRRNSLSSKVNISDLTRTNNLYENPPKGEFMFENEYVTPKLQPVQQVSSNPQLYTTPVNKQENYSSSSINEYLDILGNENGASSVEILSKPMASMTTTNATNPISSEKNSYKTKEITLGTTNRSNYKSQEKITVRDKYSIDINKSIYLVDLNGETSIVGDVNGEITVIKKFDKIINKPLQVRLDYGNVYIVRLGGYKSLVDVSDTKVGTLLEI